MRDITLNELSLISGGSNDDGLVNSYLSAVGLWGSVGALAGAAYGAYEYSTASTSFFSKLTDVALTFFGFELTDALPLYILSGIGAGYVLGATLGLSGYGIMCSLSD